MTTFQTELASLRADVDAFLAPPETTLEATPTEKEDDEVMTALFGEGMPSPDSSRAAGKHHRSNHTSDADEAHRLQKKKHQQVAVAQKESILDKKRRQQQARGIGVGPSGSLRTTVGATLVGEGATDGVPSVDPAGSGKPNPPTS
uniref:Integrase core domain containing protein n=1 Tax=Solanum tuberosum TaxID=4113 RepID=M1DAT3_SOLTU